MTHVSESELKEMAERAKRRNELYIKLVNKRDELVDKLMKHFDVLGGVTVTELSDKELDK